ncbi:hypothetical protein A1O7_01033 [Cladophialophora yegresii CBS 114405]|uniref:Uncharacterized protein n=1 Tax=Cladophialophora yegresii CBS 114405 TaxID=1182544 RepID=W9WI81_9EURO|nr:uncharacterized protein A1O7_01033 [Cladophialophora yegresii CBS 114405]EXJ64695.1 hypothetical protein A1O7_01033 [Cladophialophora yegresii CBS 114405]
MPPTQTPTTAHPTESQILQSYLLHPSPLPTIVPYTSFLALLPKHQPSRATELKRLYRDLEFQRAVTVDDIRRRIERECNKSVSLTAQLARQVRREENFKQQRQRQQQQQQKKDRNRRRKRKRGPETEHNPDHDHDDTYSYTSDDDGAETPHLDVNTHTHIQTDTALHDGVPLSNTLLQATGPGPSKHGLYHDGSSLLLAMDKATQDLGVEIADLEAEIADLRRICEGTVGGLSDLRYGRFGRARGSGNGNGNSVNDDVGNEDGVADEVLGAVEEFKAMLAGK